MGLTTGTWSALFAARFHEQTMTVQQVARNRSRARSHTCQVLLNVFGWYRTVRQTRTRGLLTLHTRTHRSHRKYTRLAVRSAQVTLATVPHLPQKGV